MKILFNGKKTYKNDFFKTVLYELQIESCDIVTLNFNTTVAKESCGSNLLSAVLKENKLLKKEADERNIAYDYLCSFEHGYEIDELGHAYIATYAVVEDVNGNRTLGKSVGLRISKVMVECFQKGLSLQEIIEKLSGRKYNSECEGIIDYLSQGLLNQKSVAADAIKNAFIFALLNAQSRKLNKELTQILQTKKD